MVTEKSFLPTFAINQRIPTFFDAHALHTVLRQRESFYSVVLPTSGKRTLLDSALITHWVKHWEMVLKELGKFFEQL